MNSDKHTWHNHEGVILESNNGFDVIDCEICGFKHITPIPTEDELEKAYQHDYYTQEKPLYLEQYNEDIDWWNMVYAERYEILEQYLPVNKRSLLDIGSGPGFFLLNGKERGWIVKGIEPSERAAEHSVNLGIDVDNAFFSKETAPGLGKFDAVNMSEVLEHIPNPAELLSLVYEQLNDDGLICIVVPNDFNPLQLLLREHLDFDPWWVAPPHHINYFDFKSLTLLVNGSGFEVIHQESTFPMEMFLLMGDNYIGDDILGRKCHQKRKLFDSNLSKTRGLQNKLRKNFSSIGLGREIVLVARKKGRNEY